MFKAVLLSQWHSLSDPELEHALAVRADVLVFCDFDDMELPDHSTLCRYRQWLMKGDLLKRLMAQINEQLEQQNLKVSNATVAVVDASIIDSKGTELLADKGYASQSNRAELGMRGLKDGIMHKAVRGRPITQDEQRRNNEIKTKRWLIEQTFGTLKRRFGLSQAKYFGQHKVLGQCYRKAMCLNLLKASNNLKQWVYSV